MELSENATADRDDAAGENNRKYTGRDRIVPDSNRRIVESACGTRLQPPQLHVG